MQSPSTGTELDVLARAKRAVEVAPVVVGRPARSSGGTTGGEGEVRRRLRIVDVDEEESELPLSLDPLLPQSTSILLLNSLSSLSSNQKTRLYSRCRRRLILIIAPFAWFLINRTLPGFQIKVFGSAPKASSFAGFNKNKITLGVLVMSGGMAGLAGVIEVSANMGQLQPEVSFGYGFTAIIVAFLGRLNPYGVIIAGIVIATAKLGADNAQMILGIPKVVTGIFEGVLLFFLLAGETVQNYKISFKRKS